MKRFALSQVLCKDGGDDDVVADPPVTAPDTLPPVDPPASATE